MMTELDEVTDEQLYEFVVGVIEEDPNRFLSEPPVKKTRLSRPKIDLWTTDWGRLLRSDKVNDPTSWEGKKFRLRFRVLYPLFKKLVCLCSKPELNIFKTIRESYIPIEFKILVSLRIFGRDTDSDTASELSGMGQSTCLNLFKPCLAVLIILIT